MDVWQLVPTACRILRQSLGLSEGERLTIVTDTEAPRLVTEALAAACASIGGVPVVVTMPPHDVGGIEPPPAVAGAMLQSEVMIFQTMAGMIHTDAARDAARSGARFLDMWGCTEEMMIRGGPTADYDEVADVSNRVHEAVRGGESVHVTTALGTDIHIPMKNRPLFCFTGHAREPGSFSAMPEGEVTICPAEGESEGVLVGPVALERRDIPFPKESFTARVERGRIAAVEGGREARLVSEMLESNGETSRNIAEFAIGTNRWSRLGVTLREAKKAYGTFHIGMGDNRSFGGSVSSPLHMDMIFEAPTITVDGREIVREGVLTVL